MISQVCFIPLHIPETGKNYTFLNILMSECRDVECKVSIFLFPYKLFVFSQYCFSLEGLDYRTMWVWECGVIIHHLWLNSPLFRIEISRDINTNTSIWSVFLSNGFTKDL